MTSIADSNSVLDPDRMLIQHQAAVTVLKGLLADPARPVLRWLDLATGRGQIINHLEHNLAEEERGRIAFYGYDIDNASTRDAEGRAERLGFSTVHFQVGEISRFHQVPELGGPWDFLTVTNVVHELTPSDLAAIFTHCIARLNSNGTLYVYDMAELATPELGAITWTAAEMRAVFREILRGLGCGQHGLAVGEWPHKSCSGWSAQILREHIGLPKGFEGTIDSAILAASRLIHSLLESKLTQTTAALDALTRRPPETAEEAGDRERLLYTFWALSRALRSAK